jgi:hypothetical protein
MSYTSTYIGGQTLLTTTYSACHDFMLRRLLAKIPVTSHGKARPCSRLTAQRLKPTPIPWRKKRLVSTISRQNRYLHNISERPAVLNKHYQSPKMPSPTAAGAGLSFGCVTRSEVRASSIASSCNRILPDSASAPMHQKSSRSGSAHVYDEDEQQSSSPAGSGHCGSHDDHSCARQHW